MKIFFYLIFIFLLSCSSDNSTTHFKGFAMTMAYNVVIGKRLTKKEQKIVDNCIKEIFSQTDKVFNNWNPSSEISRINQNQNKKNNVISEQLKALLICCNECHKVTKGRFDPTIGSIFNSWKNALLRDQLPSRLNQDALGWDKISFHKLLLQKKHLKCQLDLCGISKGYTVDLLVKKLVNLGYENFFVEWGGEVYAKGTHPKKRKWTVLINTIFKNEKKIIYLKDKAIATSGSFMMKKWEANGKSYCHIINPKTKTPLEKAEVSSVTVIAPDCYFADALATAAMTFTDQDELKKWGIEILEKSPDTSFIIINSKGQIIERISNERSNFF